MDFTWLYQPLEHLDDALAAGLGGATLPVVLLLAALLGLRHATDPDHVLAITALVAGERATAGEAARVGAWWGIGHATVLVVVGLVLILADVAMPSGVESSAELIVGMLIVALSARNLLRLLPGSRSKKSRPGRRTAPQAAGIGVVHGLGGTGAIVLLLVAAVPGTAAAAGALLLFAPMSVVSMTLCTAAYARLLTAHGPTFVVDRLVLPALALVGMTFGLWYSGLV